MKFLLDNSILIIFLATMLILLVNYARHEMKVYQLTLSEWLTTVRYDVQNRCRRLLIPVLTLFGLTIASSLIIFGNLWTSDAFHTIIFSALVGPIFSKWFKTVLG